MAFIRFFLSILKCICGPRSSPGFVEVVRVGIFENVVMREVLIQRCLWSSLWGKSEAQRICGIFTEASGLRCKTVSDMAWSQIWPLYPDTELNLRGIIWDKGKKEKKKLHYFARQSLSQVAEWWRICLPRQETREKQFQSLGQERSPGEGNGNPLQYSCLGNPKDGGSWWATVHAVTKNEATGSACIFQAKGATWANALKTVSQPGGVNEKFYSNGSKRVDLLVDILLIGGRWGKSDSASSAFLFLGLGPMDLWVPGC